MKSPTVGDAYFQVKRTMEIQKQTIAAQHQRILILLAKNAKLREELKELSEQLYGKAARL